MNRQTWYFTFGFGQRHPRTGAPLDNCYTTVDGTCSESIERMHHVFGNEWAFLYECADGPHGAGVEEFGLTYVPCVTYLPGELLPPTPHALSVGEWLLETVAIFKDFSSGKMMAHTTPYYPTLDELSRACERYGIPRDARVDYSECGSHTLVVVWDSVNSEG